MSMSMSMSAVDLYIAHNRKAPNAGRLSNLSLDQLGLLSGDRSIKTSLKCTVPFASICSINALKVLQFPTGKFLL